MRTAVSKLGIISDELSTLDPEAVGHAARQWRDTRSRLELATWGLSDRHRLARDVTSAIQAWEWYIDTTLNYTAMRAEPATPPSLQEILHSLTSGVPYETPATDEDLHRAHEEVSSAAAAAETWRQELQHLIRPGRLRRTFISAWWGIRRRLTRRR